MKNLYICFTLLLMSSVFGQDLQNAHWFVGQGVGFDFNFDPVALSVLPNPLNLDGDFYHNTSAHATLSDLDGNLLLYSDGRTLFQNWQGAVHNVHQFLPQSSVYDCRSIFVPKPNDVSNYFFIQSKPFLGSMQGLQFSEINLSNGLAELESVNVSLKDNNNVLINQSYGLTSFGLTSTVHSNDVNYWVIAHVRKQNYSKILCYEVTSSGVSPSPSSSFTFPNIIVNNITISPNASKISVATNNGLYLGTFNNTNGAMSLNLISNTNNLVYFDSAFSPNSNSLYFSANGTNQHLSVINTNSLQISNFSEIGVISGMQLAINDRIYVGNTGWNGFIIGNPDDPKNPEIIDFSTYPNFIEDDFPQWVHQQNKEDNPCAAITGISETGINEGPGYGLTWDDIADEYEIETIGDINCKHPLNLGSSYASNAYASFTVSDNFLSINQIIATLVPNTRTFRYRIKTYCGEWSEWCCFDASLNTSHFIDPEYSFPYVFPNGTCFYGDQPCSSELNLTITETVFNGSVVLEQASIITALNIISNSANADYHASEAVSLNPGFEAQAGSVFLGHIEECTNVQGKAAQQTGKKYSREVNQENVIKNEVKKDYIIISPNPSSTLVSISLDNLKMKNITVTSMDGRTMFTNNEGNIAVYKLDISNYIKGIYLVTVNTVEGKVVTGKIIKN